MYLISHSIQSSKLFLLSTKYFGLLPKTPKKAGHQKKMALTKLPKLWPKIFGHQIYKEGRESWCQKIKHLGEFSFFLVRFEMNSGVTRLINFWQLFLLVKTS